jgi:hypothetical protein
MCIRPQSEINFAWLVYENGLMTCKFCKIIILSFCVFSVALPRMGTSLPVEREITPAKIVILESNPDFELFRDL